MLTAEQFLEQWPEFQAVADSDPGIIAAKLAVAAALTDPDVFGDPDVTNQAHGLLTAHLLQADPSGREARIKDDPEHTSVYLSARRALEALVGSHWVIG